jgi:hypothetical protein
MTTVFLAFCVVVLAGIFLAGIVELAQVFARAFSKPWGDVPPPSQETWRNANSPRSRDLLSKYRRVL